MKRLVILGAGESGVGTALLGKQKGYEVFVSDLQNIKENYKNVLINNEIVWEENKHTPELIFNADVVMKSPGIPETVAIVKQLLAKKIPVISEIEFAAHFTNATIIGITGSNGKTTTATLTHFILKNAGLHVGLAGNIGISFAKQVAQNEYDYYVLEISSFQLDGIDKFRPHIAVLLNITEDHLDRYENSFKKYIASKFRISKNLQQSNYFIYDHDDAVITNNLKKVPKVAQKIPFSLKRNLEQGTCIKNKQITLNINNTTMQMPTNSFELLGEHNLKNAMAAATVAKLLNIRKETIRESLKSFQGVEHRLESVLKIQNVTYVNDSKATNVNATFYALESMTAPTIWIVGGVDKGNEYEALLPLVNEKVKAIICLGIDNQKIINSFGNVVPVITETQSMKQAVQIAYQQSERGDMVLLSPACASFDLFENYEDRGRQFKEAVRNL